ncbi:hypothetical protein IMZ48_43115 [Candidatus Bathyarchaeota archaeon]|nr:hypothetical protein [Candidatus Bathyarchaeota archaeon]
MAFGRAIAGSETPAFLLRWSDDGQTVTHGDINVAMDGFRRLPEAMLEDAGRLCTEMMTGGGQPRSPDLLGLRVRNCGTSERGFYVYNGSIIYLTRSHKAKRSTNREFVVARFLPVQVGTSDPLSTC